MQWLDPMRLLLALPLLLAACGAVTVEQDEPPPPGPPPPPPPAAPQAPAASREVAPATAFAADTQNPTSPHWVYPGQNGRGAGKLLVFLHGMGGRPSGYARFLDHASALGFHVIGLSYWDTSQLAGSGRLDAVCDLDSDGIDAAESGCWGEAHREMFDGQATASPFDEPANVDMQDRLDHLLEYLAATYPAEGWAQFLVDGHPSWPSIVLAGHSMGAGNAAWIAQRRPVLRLVMLAQPADFVIDGTLSVPADWVDDGFSALSPNAMYGLSHVADTNALHERVLENWSWFGMAADHQLSSDAPVGDPHSSVAQDEATYGERWTYLLTDGL